MNLSFLHFAFILVRMYVCRFEGTFLKMLVLAIVNSYLQLILKNMTFFFQRSQLFRLIC